ncbi:hypothetical protein [Bradyrhizobium sp. LTSPM299]|uniref:hypothetical protein n=1 Tax=Bradyrhizobium sp. LTSPM299 TaxID=1619233 RepID=UPI0005C92C8C|nr:hypothetical protein [Bradyrhizobium sp. LTSPM299]
MKCLSIVLALAVMGGAGTQAIADNGGQSAECKEITARLIELTGTTFDRYSPSGDNVFFKKPDMHLSCMSHRITGVSLSWDDSGFPPNTWFNLLALAGKAVTGVDVRTLEVASHRCHRAALKEKSELADLDIPNAKIECQAFTRHGGGVDIGIWINDHEARKWIEER